MHKIKIIIRDNKMAADAVGGGGAPLPNIIPSKSPSPPWDPAPRSPFALSVVVDPPPYDMLTLLSLYHVTTQPAYK